MTPTRVRVYIADDHPLFRDGLLDAIRRRPDLELVGSADNGGDALREIEALLPDVAVLDVRMPVLDGPGVLAALRRDGLATRVMFLSASVEPEVVYEAVSGGASGYLSKDSDRSEICDGICQVARGEVLLPPRLQAEFVAQVRAHRDRSDAPTLSAREREVVRLTAQGLSAAVIGERLHLSPATVKTYLQRVYEKLGVGDRAAMVAEAIRRGLIE